jgi:hypothetical protein
MMPEGRPSKQAPSPPRQLDPLVGQPTRAARDTSDRTRSAATVAQPWRSRTGLPILLSPERPTLLHGRRASSLVSPASIAAALQETDETRALAEGALTALPLQGECVTSTEYPGVSRWQSYETSLVSS